MKHLRSGHSLLSTLLLAAALVGCGGDGGHHGGGSTDSETTSLAFTASEDYNGANTDLRGETTVNPSFDNVSLRLTNGERTLLVNVPYDSLRQGATISPSTANALFDYREVVGTGTRIWQATSGSVTITKLTDTKATVSVDDLAFSPFGNEGNTATGTFTARGRIVDVPIASG